jgi:hypothetical protein
MNIKNCNPNIKSKNEIVSIDKFKDILSDYEYSLIKNFNLLTTKNLAYLPKGTKIKYIDRQTFQFYKGGNLLKSTKNFLFISKKGYNRGEKCLYSKIVYPEFSYILYKEPKNLTMGDQLSYILKGLESNSIKITKLLN